MQPASSSGDSPGAPSDRNSGVQDKIPFALRPVRTKDKVLGVVLGLGAALLVLAVAWLLLAKNAQ